MKIVPILQKYDYGIKERGESLEKRGFLPALKATCEHVAPFWLEEHSYTNRIALQHEIIDFINTENPDIVFFILMKDEVTLETLSQLSKKYITINWFCDDSWRFEDFTRIVAPNLTYSITTDKYSLDKYKKIGIANVILARWASYDYSMNLNLQQIKYKYDITFIGSKNSTREWIINSLRKNYDVKCFGAGWENGRVSFDELKDIVLHSKINLNLSNSVSHDIRYITASEANKLEYQSIKKRVEQIKARNFEIPCFGGFQVSQYTPGIEDYFTIGKEIVVFSTIDELDLVIDYYLNNDLERKKIQDAGYKKAKKYTYTEIMKEVIKKIKEDNSIGSGFAKKKVKHNMSENKNQVDDKLKKAAIYVPDFYCKNRLFNLVDQVSNRDNCLYHFHLLKEKFKEKGYDLSTYDMNDLEQSEFVIYHDMPTELSHSNNYLVMFESKLIRPDNWQQEQHQHFMKIFTWNDDLVDGKKYIKYFWPNKIPETIDFDISSKSKLCTMIAGHKLKVHPLELYSERIRAIRWFEEKHIEDFDLYGMDWDKSLDVSKRILLDTNNYPSYRGSVESKNEILGKYKFCLCYENVKGVNGYITEKIFDCFFAGCIPIYLGAPNVTDFIPKNTFIDKRNFDTYEELYDYMKHMSESEYLNYITAITEFIKSDEIRKFSAAHFVEIIINGILETMQVK